MADGWRIDVDARQVEDYLAAAPGGMRDVIELYQKRGALVVEALQKDEAAGRLGVEVAESRMTHPDPSRPKGIYINSIRSRTRGDVVDIGPNVAYSWWIERGSQAPTGVPATHAASAFIGHRVVERATRDAVEPLTVVMTETLRQATADAVRAAGGKG